MHICLITGEYPRKGVNHGGIGTFAKIFSEALLETGHKVSVIGKRRPSEPHLQTINGVTLHGLDVDGIFPEFLTYFRRLNETIRRIHETEPIDIVEGAELSFAFISKIEGIKYVIRLHGGHYFFSSELNGKRNKWKSLQENLSFRKADAFIAVSDYVKAVTEQFHQIKARPQRVIYSPIPNSGDGSSRIDKHHKPIVFAGTICRKKGVQELVEAFALLPNAGAGYSLDLIGRDSEHPNGGSFIKTLKGTLPSSIRERVVFHGALPKEEVLARFGAAEFCIFPSHSETLGLVAPEAMSLGKVVIFTRNGPGREVIDDGIDGFLCDPTDPSDIAEVMRKVIAMSPEEKSSMGERARNKVMKRFGIDSVIQKNLEFYSSLIA